VSANSTLDGVIQDPAGDEGFGRGGWVGLLAKEERCVSTNSQKPPASQKPDGSTMRFWHYSKVGNAPSGIRA
jgi:hypothetical protein